ncbi:MAG: MMPL family transporter [Propionicimonas sp.]|uniref:MMPL family transporter n=1 Tax=Propionicimonas sp. TaxID=1955623 RepID=UPI003D10BA69
MSSFLYRIGRASYRRRGRVLAGWLVVLALLGTLAATLGGAFNDTFEIPGAESTTALAELKVTFPEAADATATVLITTPEGKLLTDKDVRKAVEDWSDSLEDIPWVNGVIGPYSDYVDGLISADDTSGRVMVRVEGTSSTFTDAQREELTTAVETLEQTLPGSRVLIGGEVFSIHVPHITVVEALGLVVALVVLLITLGSVIASMMPIGTAIAGVGIGVLVVQVAAGVITISSTTLMLAIMLGLAVGIDYALFILSRHRDQLAAGMEPEESAARAIGTAGSAVVFAGLTVIIALIGLSISRVPFLAVMGIFAAVTVAFEVLLALTLLPAFLGFAGERLRPKPKRSRRGPDAVAASAGSETAANPAAPAAAEQEQGRKRFNPSAWWVGVVTKWPIVTIVLVLVGLGGLALPTKDLYLALPTSGRSLPGTQDRETFDEISRIFGVGFNGPLIITGSIVESDEPLDIMDCLRDDITQIPGVRMVASATPNENADTGMVQVIPTTGPDDPATADLVQELRNRHDYWQQTCGIDTAITGFTAVQIDVTNQLWGALLPFGIFVVGLSLVLLTMVFRSIWVPIKAAAGYLLSVGGAFGATTLVFNQGWFKEVINLPEAGPVISFLPIILMGLLFGLAMDYEVFLVSRMREEFVHGNTERSVEDGFIHSSKVVVAAALIMFSVFAFFVPAGEGAIKPIAFALAVGVALDAFVVRMTLVPAVMKLLGRHAWWLPSWLDARLPSFDIEGESLTRQVHLADWPAAGDSAAIVGEGLTAEVGERTLFADLAVRVEPGQVLVVEGEHAPRRALLLALAGRVRLTGGNLKVLGHVLPEEAPVVRNRIPVLGASVSHFGRVLKKQAGGVVVVDGADELSDTQDRSLRRALAASAEAAGEGEPVTWVLGVLPGSDLEAQLPVPFQVLKLASHLALEGTNR